MATEGFDCHRIDTNNARLARCALAAQNLRPPAALME
jgi:hypothetical protein